MPNQGSLAITSRNGGDRWYGRVSIPETVAREAGFREGSRVSARNEDGSIVIFQDDCGRIKFPGAKGRSFPRHSFEAATSTLGLSDTHLAQQTTKVEVIKGEIVVFVPEGYMAKDLKGRRKIRRDIPKPIKKTSDEIRVPRTTDFGTASTLLTDANRQGKAVRPMTLSQMIDELGKHGTTVEKMGPRLFKMNGDTASLADVQDACSKALGASDHDRIVLVLD